MTRGKAYLKPLVVNTALRSRAEALTRSLVLVMFGFVFTLCKADHIAFFKFAEWRSDMSEYTQEMSHKND